MLLYDFSIQLYSLAARIAAINNKKALKWVIGRKNQHVPTLASSQKTVWMHVASLGEFEQGKPVLEQLKKRYPNLAIVLTFFSPSGYEQKKESPIADYIFYLPIDTKNNAQQFIKSINPDLAIFVKYDLWLHYLIELKNQSIPAILISGIFRPQHRYFKWYGGVFRTMLDQLDHIIVQDKTSASLLIEKLQLHAKVYGDTRVDRVAAGVDQAQIHPSIQKWAAPKQRILVFGSTWPVSEKMLVDVLNSPRFPKDVSIIIAPHDISVEHLCPLSKQLDRYGYALLSHLLEGDNQDLIDKRILFVDTIGHLSSLYGLGQAAYVGGGFTGDLHNILEAAAWEAPIIIGPKFSRFHEAVTLSREGKAVRVIHNSEELEQQLLYWLNNEAARQSAAQAARLYIDQNIGATNKIIDLIQKHYDDRLC